MRLVYVDEAGISNLTEEPTMVYSAVIVDGDSERDHVETYLRQLVRKWIPDERQCGFVFHASQLFNGGGPVFARESWPRTKRLEIANDIADAFRWFQLPIAFAAIQRNEAPFLAAVRSAIDSGVAGRNASAIEQMGAYLACLKEVDRWMISHAPSENCVIICEENSTARRLITEGHRTFQSSEGDLSFRRVREDPQFQPKSAGSLLQLADFSAYVIKRCATAYHAGAHDDHGLYQAILGRMKHCLVRLGDRSG